MSIFPSVQLLLLAPQATIRMLRGANVCTASICVNSIVLWGVPACRQRAVDQQLRYVPAASVCADAGVYPRLDMLEISSMAEDDPYRVSRLNFRQQCSWRGGCFLCLPTS